MKIVFWPVLNHGEPGINATIAAECVARQDINAFWELHHHFFQNQADLWRADGDYYAQAAGSAGIDAAQFTACYDDGDARAHVLALDEGRRQRGIFSQPVFDVGGELLYGSQAFSTFEQLINAALQQIDG